MHPEIFMEIDRIQTELDSGIGLIAVVADGLDAFSQVSSLSCKDGQRYINALYLIFDILSAMSGRFREQLGRARKQVS